MCTMMSMLAQLEAAVGAADLPLDAAALRRAIALLDRLQARLSRTIGEFDHAGLWALEGATSMTAWLKTTGHTARDARVLARTAATLRTLPVTREAWVDGVLSGGQVSVISANLRDATVEHFAEQYAGLVPSQAALPVHHAVTVMRRWAEQAEDAL